MAVRESASQQFKEAIKQPTIIHVNLLAELLASKLPPKLRDTTRLEIIRNLLQQAGYLALALPHAPLVHRHFQIRRHEIAAPGDQEAVISSRLEQLLAEEDLREMLPRPAVRGPRPRQDTGLANDEGSQT